MPEYTTPGVYIEEIPNLPPSISSVETAIPAFIGYTEKAQKVNAGDLTNKPCRIESMLEYENYFGYADPEQGIEIIFYNTDSNLNLRGSVAAALQSHYLMYYSLQIFFLNGGGPCWIVSIGSYTNGGIIKVTVLKRGLRLVKKIEEVTLLLFPDAMNLESHSNYYSLYKKAMEQCVALENRFTLMDVFHIHRKGSGWKEDIAFLRNALPGDTDLLKYAAAYFPKIYTGINFYTADRLVKIVSNGAGELPGTLAELKQSSNSWYLLALNAVNDIEMLLPVTPAVAGVYAQIDNALGVWKAPANVNINTSIRPEYVLSTQEQQDLNDNASQGKYINVIRTFTGRGPAIIWGARTLAGDDNEWRYIPVRRFFNMVEESCKNATQQFVFEPNDANTWVRVVSMIENYLTQQWKAGALMGATTKDAFFVRVGLGTTMTQADIVEGHMIVEIGMAVVRPAEFIILRFTHKMMDNVSHLT